MIFIFENFIKKLKPFRLSLLCLSYLPVAFLFIAAFLLTSSIFNDSPLHAQQRNQIKKTAQAPARAPDAKKNINTAAPQNITRLFDAAFESEISDINFIEEMTDEIEFRRIYKSLADDIGKLKEALVKAVISADKNYHGCLVTAKNKHARELKAAEAKIKQNSDPGRIESLNSLLSLLKQEQNDYYKAEADKAVIIFKSLFDSFLNAYHIQKDFLTINTSYESSASEAMTALDTFESYIKNKNERIEKYIYNKFDKIINGAGHDNK
jgi:hypothetical protein